MKREPQTSQLAEISRVPIPQAVWPWNRAVVYFFTGASLLPVLPYARPTERHIPHRWVSVGGR